MNTYNDNLRNSVVNSLKSQLTSLNEAEAVLSASTYKLFFAEGAKIKAKQKLHDDHEIYKFQQQLKEQAVLNNNLAVNVDSTAQNQKAHTALSVTNTSVCAANVQAAANSILRLASNVGSIYSMVNAANYETEIYKMASEANRLMSFTAYDAEKASDIAMNVSALTAKVSASTVADMSTAAKKGVANLLAIAQADFSTIASRVAADNADLAQANDYEKQAEGEVEFKNADFFALQSAYVAANRELNLNLKVDGSKTTGSSFEVTFNFLHSAFKFPNSEEDGTGFAPAGYPVKAYYIMVVKNSRKAVFSQSNAEAVLANHSQFILIDEKPEFNQRFIKQKVYLSDLNDTDGDSLKYGVEYVVFVYATFMEEYKKLINNFDEHLSAPSNSFSLTSKLSAPKASDIKISKESNSILEFEVLEHKSAEVEYRCFLLPDQPNQVAGLLTELGLRKLERELEARERIADKFVPQVTKVEADILSVRSEIEGIRERQTNIRIEEKDPETESKTLTKLRNEYEANEQKHEDLSDELRQLEAQLKDLQKEQKHAIRRMLNVEKANPGFFFNADIASTISPANYTLAQVNSNSAKLKEQQKEKGGVHPKNYVTRFMQVSFEDDTNDVFGNEIENNVRYIPAIFAVSTSLAENQKQFSNSLSDFEKTKAITNIVPKEKN